MNENRMIQREGGLPASTPRPLALLICAILAAGALFPAVAEEIDLGIPTSAPWMDPVAAETGGAEAAVEKAKHPLEIRFWERVEDDLRGIGRWRSSLLGVLRLSASKKAAPVFPPSPVERPHLLQEYREAARATWAKAMDCWLALDSMLARYGEFHALEERKVRSAAFLTARAILLSQARFARQWAVVAGRDPALAKLFDEPIRSLGLPAGAFTRIQDRFGGGAPARFSRALRVYEASADRWALDGVLGEAGRAWRQARKRDAAFLPKASRRRMGFAQALRILEEEALVPTFPVLSSAGDPGEDVELQGVRRPPLFPPGKDDAAVSVSSQIVYAVDTVRHWFQLDPPGGRRPEVLLSTAQVRGLAGVLRPGDVLLLRRERYVGSIGQPGFWHAAGLFVGEERSRRKFFGGDSVSEQLRARHPEAYRKHRGPDARSRPRTVASSDWGGVGLFDLERFARADSLAVLRPRLEPGRIAQALDIAFGAVGSPFDPDNDMASRDALGDAELVVLSLLSDRDRPGLSPAPADFFGRRLIRANMFVRRFDRRFGTPEQRLDFVDFFDAIEAKYASGSAPLEELRRSWRRPKWVMKAEKESSDEE